MTLVTMLKINVHFLENIISDDDPNEINLDEDNLTFDENEISDDDKQEYIQELTDKKYLKFRFNFEVKLQDGSMEKTYLEHFISQKKY